MTTPTTDYRLRISARQIVRVATHGERVKTGKAMDDVEVLEHGTMIVGHDGKIVAVGPREEISAAFAGKTFETELDYKDQTIVPGLVDSHTHPVWSGDRVHEFKMKLAGATYMEIHKSGGGIGFTVRHTRASSEDELLQLFLARLKRMVRSGTVLVEAKSGYGLELDTELKMLKVIHRATQVQKDIDIVANYCGAHSVPPGSTAEAATKDIIENQLPALAAAKADGQINPEQIDVFCEKGVFTTEQSKAILEAGKKYGLTINFHGDELHPTGSCEMGASIGALAVSHVEHVSDAGIAEMAKAGTVAVLLPTTAYVLRIEPAPARKLIDSGVPVALGSDFNPNAHCLSMPFVMNLACVNMRMTLNEALTAATINSAAALGKSSTHGSLEAGKFADFLLINAESWEHLIYEMVDPPISKVFKGGRVVYESTVE